MKLMIIYNFNYSNVFYELISFMHLVGKIFNY